MKSDDITYKAITADKLADNSVTTSAIRDQSIPGSKLYNFTITNDQMAENSIRAANIVNGAVTGDKIWNDAITTPKIVDGAVTGDKLAEKTINTPKIMDGAITFDKIADLTINTPKIRNFAISKSKLYTYELTNTIHVSDTSQNSLIGHTIDCDYAEIIELTYIEHESYYSDSTHMKYPLLNTSITGNTITFTFGIEKDNMKNLVDVVGDFIDKSKNNYFKVTAINHRTESLYPLKSITSDNLSDEIALTESEIDSVIQ